MYQTQQVLADAEKIILAAQTATNATEQLTTQIEKSLNEANATADEKLAKANQEIQGDLEEMDEATIALVRDTQ